jgi:riboflavin synthase alpha subunit
MFTGLVREIGTLRTVARRGTLTKLWVHAPASAPELGLGDSLAVNGVCLTVTELRGDLVQLDAVSETREVTTLAGWRAGRRVHLEPALKAGDPLGGHLVLGHVDGVGVLSRRRTLGENLLLTFEVPAEMRVWLLPKGSIAVDGVSLTLDAGPFHDGFTVSLIPHSLSWTRFGEMKTGERVNLEADVLAKGGAARDAMDTPAGDGTRPLTVNDITARGFRRGRRR